VRTTTVDEAPARDDEAPALGDETREEGQVDTAEDVPEQPPAPRPPRYVPPSNWEPPEPDARRTARTPDAEPAAPEGPNHEGMKIVRLDADSYYLIDPMRKLCFLRHKESMTAIDCAKIPEASEQPAPVERPAKRVSPPEADRKPAPSRLPEPEPSKRDEGAKPSSPSPGELLRFESAFIAIYCDRKHRDDTPPETRITEHGLATVRYEAIEAWWAADANAWYTLTTRASKDCSR